MHDNLIETPEDVDRQLAAAKIALADFESRVDNQRLLERLRTVAPAHPLLLVRFLFGALAALCALVGVVVLVLAQVSADFARNLAMFETVIPFPDAVPAFPALLALIALSMGFAWLMATLAALALARDAPMLNWEHKQYQKLVNDVTRLNTQRAVMERIRNTPAGARPRIATPVPVGSRRTTPTAYSPDRGVSYSPNGALAATRAAPILAPSPAEVLAARTPSARGATPRGPGGDGGFGTRPHGRTPVAAHPAPHVSNHGERTPHAAPPPRPEFAPSPVLRFGSAEPEPRPRETPADPGSATQPDPEEHREPLRRAAVSLPAHPNGDRGPRAAPNGDRGPQAAPSSPDQPAVVALDADGAEGILARVRSGALSGTRPTPYGSAGRVRLPPPAVTVRANGSDVAQGQHTRGGTPLGAPPKAGIPAGQARRADAGAVRTRTPPMSNDRAQVTPSERVLGSTPGQTPQRATRIGSARGRSPGEADRRDIFGTPPVASQGRVAPLEWQNNRSDPGEAAELAPELVPTVPERRSLPALTGDVEAWLVVAVQKARDLNASLPPQASIELSREPHLPFSLVLDQASPTVAVRAMINFVELLANIPVPERARIEFRGAMNLDGSFYKNVKAALKPYFAQSADVKPGPGQVDIRFETPDPRWAEHAWLPVQR